MEDSTGVARNWAIFIVLAAGLAYYWSRDKKQKGTTRSRTQSSAAGTETARSEKSSATKPVKKTSPTGVVKDAQQSTTTSAQRQKRDVLAQRKTESRTPAMQKDEIDRDEPDVQDFARRMNQARSGVDVKKVEAKSGLGRTVKQNHAEDSPARSWVSSQEAAQMEDKSLQRREAGGVEDMLEPVSPGPSTLRIVASENSARATTRENPRKDSKDAQQSKKARQNAKKKEQERLQREVDEKHRKVLMESQRRTAREARGEPARNGVPVAKVPANNIWTAKTPSVDTPIETAASNQAALLDTFDAESTGSSNPEAEHSTAATSTTDGAPSHWGDEMPSNHNDMARALQESLNDGAWTTAGSRKKQRKTQPSTASLGNATPTAALKPTSARAMVDKPSGFHALQDEYERRTDVDANDASNWDA